MTTVTTMRCDRCGKAGIPNTPTFDEIGWTPIELTTYERFDLCPQCTSDLIRWIHNHDQLPRTTQ